MVAPAKQHTPALKHAPGVPDGVPFKPRDENFKKPVAWLLGRQLVSSLKWVALYTAFKGKLDIRDWMNAQPFRCDCPDGATEYWFDYIADTGDGQKATYSIAYMCLSDLWIATQPPSLPNVGENVRFKWDSRDGNIVESQKTDLPRGQFLFVGGDTAYHIADYRTLAERVQAPFCWAWDDLYNGKLTHPFKRPIFGIPGNHDYYDEIDGFNRMFRRPAQVKGMRPQLVVPAFDRPQESSFVAIELPFGWWLWGLDIENSTPDPRQREFFTSLNNGKIPDKLIVATPEPTTVLGKPADPSDKTSRAFNDLGLEQPFLNGGKLAAGKCRLDISGDTHHYERYWGPASIGGAPAATNYASVVSGMGGAFLHPSETDAGLLPRQSVYPSPADSRRAMTRRLMNPWNILTGGFVWLAGLIISCTIYFGATASPNTKNLVDRLVLRGVAEISTERLVDLGGLKRGLPIAADSDLSAFGKSMVIMLSAVPVVLVIVFAIFYSRRLFARTHERELTRWEYLQGPVWLAAIAATGLSTIMVWKAGTGQYSHIVGDGAFALTVLVVVIGLVVFAAKAGAEMHGPVGIACFVVLGLWHALLQLAVPLFQLRLATWSSALSSLIVLGGFVPLAMILAARNLRYPLVLSWLVCGFLLLYLPARFADSEALSPAGFGMNLILVALAGATGAVLSCVWLGSYLTVSLAFNGNNNEAGGAARVEEFKQFIRFRVTEQDITGFVIGFQKPESDGEKLLPKIIDVFKLA